jgi:hypothetical protein
VAVGSKPATLQQGALNLALPEALSVRDLDDEVILALETPHSPTRTVCLISTAASRFATAAPNDAFVI